MSPVTCHLSPTPTATDPPPANSPICTVGWCAMTEPKNPNKLQNKKIIKTFLKKGFGVWQFYRYVFDQKSPALLVPVADGEDGQRTN